MAQREQIRPASLRFGPRTRADRYKERATNAGRALRKNPNMLLGVIIILFMIVTALLANPLSTYDPRYLAPNDRLISPLGNEVDSSGPELVLDLDLGYHFFGTDHLGRDVLARTLFGSRASLQVGIFVALGTIILGTTLGLISGYHRVLDFIVMRVADGLMAIPSFLLAIALMTLLGPSLRNVVIALVISSVPGTTRFVRSIVLSLREREFVLAARAIGGGPIRIMAHHIFPNTIPPVLVLASFITAGAILSEAGLSFLGAGLPSDVPSWGNMMGQGRAFNSIAPWMLFFPGLFLSLTVLGANLLGDGLRDTLDPRLRRLQ
ncbi:MAG: ABC transporter permease [Chloroflexi bacterium]|nr:ABC transporter permease [Chloroflexota bacterium]